MDKIDIELGKLAKGVLAKGQATKDTKQATTGLYGMNFSLKLMTQIQQDGRRGIKYFDGLYKWLGQGEHWTDNDNKVLKKLAEDYLKEGGEIGNGKSKE